MEHTKRIMWLGRELECPKDHPAYGIATLFIRSVLPANQLSAWFKSLKWEGGRVWLCKEFFDEAATTTNNFRNVCRRLLDLVGHQGVIAVEIPMATVVHPFPSSKDGVRLSEFFKLAQTQGGAPMLERHIRFPQLSFTFGDRDCLGFTYRRPGFRGYLHLMASPYNTSSEEIYGKDCLLLPCPLNGRVGGPGMVDANWQSRVSDWMNWHTLSYGSEEEARRQVLIRREKADKEAFDAAVGEEVAKRLAEMNKDKTAPKKAKATSVREAKDTTVFITTSFVGFHRWPDAPDEVSFLRDRHRHVFHVKVELRHRPADGERSIEYLMFKDAVDFLINTDLKDDLEAHDTWSCEEMALRLGRLIIDRHADEDIEMKPGTVDVTISEDGENGSKVTL